MIKINVVAVGKIKEKYYAEGVSEYAKRLSKFCDFNVIEVKEENYEKYENLIPQIKKAEEERILPKLRGKVYALAIEGKQTDSVGFSEIIKDAIDVGSEITFVIGGSYGLSDEIKRKANGLISFSKMTFPHALFRVILSEQIYRAFTIISGTGYHK